MLTLRSQLVLHSSRLPAEWTVELVGVGKQGGNSVAPLTQEPYRVLQKPRCTALLAMGEQRGDIRNPRHVYQRLPDPHPNRNDGKAGRHNAIIHQYALVA